MLSDARESDAFYAFSASRVAIVVDQRRRRRRKTTAREMLQRRAQCPTS